MKPRDDNDRLRENELPLSPLVGCDPVADAAAAETASPSDLPWRTVEQLEQDVAKTPRVFLWPGVFANGTVAVFSGEPKAGKSEIVLAFVAAVTRGSPGWVTRHRPERSCSLARKATTTCWRKLERYGAKRENVQLLSRDALKEFPSWSQVLASAAERAREIGATLLVIDTFSFWAGIEGDGERVEGVVQACMKVLQSMRDAGVATILVHHATKSRDVEGVASVRGSGAIAGAAEAVVVFKRLAKDVNDQRRKLDIYSRIGECSGLVVKRVRPEGGEPCYVVDSASDGREPGNFGAEQKLIRGLAEVGDWVPRARLPELTGLSNRALDGALPALVKLRKIERRGSGKAGAPFEYRVAGLSGD